MAVGAFLALGIGGGFAVGASAMVERAALAAIARAEDRLGVTIDADAVEWSWGGEVVVSGLSVSPLSGGVPLLQAQRVVIDGDPDLLGRRYVVASVTVDGIEVRAQRRPPGPWNFQGVLDAIRPRTSAHAESDVAGTRLRRVDLSAMEVSVSGLSLVVDGVPDRLPLGIVMPEQVSLDGGRLSTSRRAVGDEGATTVVVGSFDETSLDPGFGLSFEMSWGGPGAPSGLPQSGSVTFDRPARAYLKRRVVGAAGLSWSPDSVALLGLQLSVPVGDDGAGGDSEGSPQPRVSAAAAVGKIEARIAGGLGAALRLRNLESVARALTEVRVEAPVVSWAWAPDGRHSFQDLVGPLPLGPVTSDSAPPGAGQAAVGILEDATLEAIAALLVAPGGGRSEVDSLRRRVLRLTGPLHRRAIAVGGALDRALDRLAPLGVLKVIGGEFTLRLGGLDISVEDVAATVSGGTAPSVEVSVVMPLVTRRPTLLRVARGEGPGPGGGAGAGAGDGAPTAISVGVTVSGVALGPLAKSERSGRLARWAGDATVLYDARVALKWQGPWLAFEADGALAALQINAPTLSAVPIHTDLALDLSGRARLNEGGEAAPYWEIDDAHLRLGDWTIAAGGRVDDPLKAPRLALKLHMDETPVQDVIDGFPRGLRPQLKGLIAEGTLSWDVDTSLDTLDVQALVIESVPRLTGFSVREMGNHVDLDGLKSAVIYSTRDADGQPDRRAAGPDTSGWVPLDAIAPWIVKAVTTTEDGAFYRHAGYSPFAIRSSIIADLRQGEFVRGGSTITQQLVKNLFLSSDKTISRKLQEVFLATQVEQVLSKDEIMTWYLNIIEWGPGIYGVGEAAQHYFAKAPVDLTLVECIFLSSIIPSPRRYHRFWEEGAVTGRWSRYLGTLLGVMVTRGKITEAERRAQAPFTPRFVGYPADPGGVGPDGMGGLDDLDDIPGLPMAP